jgi:hypothetical protein
VTNSAKQSVFIMSNRQHKNKTVSVNFLSRGDKAEIAALHIKPRCAQNGRYEKPTYVLHSLILKIRL